MSRAAKCKSHQRGRAAALRVQISARRFKTFDSIVSPLQDVPDDSPWPLPLRSALRVAEEHPDVVRGDGSRRRCAELRDGFRRYREFVRDLADGAQPCFAVYLWEACGPNEFPAYDFVDVDPERLAYAVQSPVTTPWWDYLHLGTQDQEQHVQIAIEKPMRGRPRRNAARVLRDWSEHITINQARGGL